MVLEGGVDGEDGARAETDLADGAVGEDPEVLGAFAEVDHQARSGGEIG